MGSSLTMESIPKESRGFVSGLLQAGYPSGYLLATLAFGQLFEHIGWRGMFMLSLLPALLTLYIRRNVPESRAGKPRNITINPDCCRRYPRNGGCRCTPSS
ncbi:Sialic acid permease [Chromobacterium violaceum]|uniref:Sialic acid permease n=1 Tax=Chromobacterium violaceum TaxID=536 RepID=A0A447TDR5_CHRVL|nr:Sialic acid permease [Chromobacterium violaceum]